MKPGAFPGLPTPLVVLSVRERQGTGIVPEKEVFLLIALISNMMKKAEALSKEKNHFTALINAREEAENLAKEISRYFTAEETILKNNSIRPKAKSKFFITH